MLVVQHLEPEAPYAIEEALRAAGSPVEVVRTDRDQWPPGDSGGLAGLVCMGGPMSAYDDAGFPTRRTELALMADAVARGVPALGVCLGAQLLAAAAGGRAHRGNGAEIGWGPIDLTVEAAADPLLSCLPRRFVVLHWHSDTFTPPAGAVQLATSSRYANQAFRIGRAWGLQFHLEVDAGAVTAFLDAMPAEADRAPGGVDAIRGEAKRALDHLAPIRARVLHRFAEMVTGRASSGVLGSGNSRS